MKTQTTQEFIRKIKASNTKALNKIARKEGYPRGYKQMQEEALNSSSLNTLQEARQEAIVPVLSSCIAVEPSQAVKEYCLNNKSIIPTIQECERFIGFLNTYFSLNLPNNLLINIHKTNKNTMGYFTPTENPEHYTDSKTEKTALNSITLSSYFLNINPYDTLTHELTHFINNNNKIKDCSSNQYHNKKFKIQAEKLLLKVSKTNKGYAHTEQTEEFNKMLEEYKPNYEVFKILQEIQEKGKKGSRLYLFTCSNECYKVRCGDKQLRAICGCGEPFIQVE